MRSLALVMAALAAGASHPAQAQGACAPEWNDALLRVDAIADNGVLTLEDGRRIRLAGAVAAETMANGFPDWMRAQLEGQAVHLAETGGDPRPDRWGIGTAFVRRADGLFADLAAIRAGQALAAPGIRDRDCARELREAEPGAPLGASLDADNLGTLIRTEGTLRSLRKSQSRVYMTLDTGPGGMLMITMRLADYEQVAPETDLLPGAHVGIRGYLEWWDQPAIVSSSPWDLVVTGGKDGS